MVKGDRQFMDIQKVNQLSKVDTTKYKEGTVFLTSQSIAILHNGKVEPLVKQSQVKKLIQDEVKKAVKASE